MVKSGIKHAVVNILKHLMRPEGVGGAGVSQSSEPQSKLVPSGKESQPLYALLLDASV